MSLYIGVLNQGMQEAEKSNFRFQIGAVIFKGSKIISSSYNQDRKFVWKLKNFRNNSNFLHAEQSAILKVKNRDIRGYSIFIVRINRNTGKISLAYPCEDCFSLIEDYGMKNIYYTNRIGEIKCFNINKRKHIDVW